jgi:hypothetical protein
LACGMRGRSGRAPPSATAPRAPSSRACAAAPPPGRMRVPHSAPAGRLQAGQHAALRGLLGELRSAQGGGLAAEGLSPPPSVPGDAARLLPGPLPTEQQFVTRLFGEEGSVAGDLPPALDLGLAAAAPSRSRVVADPALRADMARGRRELPAAAQRDTLLAAMRAHRVVVVSGETGSGKTTQVPQFLLEDAAVHGGEVNILCTQPRRISAITVAERVAQERGERQLGGSVGYSVRLDSVLPRGLVQVEDDGVLGTSSTGGTVTFCTPGICMRRLATDPLLTGVTHVLLDEVHERDIMTDLLATLLSDLLVHRQDLKIVLMSATLNAPLFARYFAQVGTHRCTI